MFLFHKKKAAIAFILFAIIMGSIAATTPPKKRNLKVLPENISHDSLDQLMDYYKYSLNVKCGYCHAHSVDKPKKLDMASDDNPIKDVTRKMILMTNEMNEKYIHTINHPTTDSNTVQLVTCNTCHRGQAKPVVPSK